MVCVNRDLLIIDLLNIVRCIKEYNYMTGIKSLTFHVLSCCNSFHIVEINLKQSIILLKG